ncbi:MAG: DUF4062 domain-containing protein [Dehalococcoidia bacterium]
MPAPRVFVSSTFYDLKYIRENLKHFITSLGYEAVLSEEGRIYFDPEKNVQEAAVAEVPSCQILVLIIGGRFGSGYMGTHESITNNEYRKAVEHKVPIFALVERDVYQQFRVYLFNRGNDQVNASAIKYPGVDSHRIFDFVEEVQGQAFNNALVPFSDFEDVRAYLQQQWASMMFSFLTSRSEAQRVADMLGALTEIGQKVEFLTEEVLRKVGDEITDLSLALYDVMLDTGEGRSIVERIDYFAVPTPALFIAFESLEEAMKASGASVLRLEDALDFIWLDGRSLRVWDMGFHDDSKLFGGVRQSMLDLLTARGITPEEYLERNATVLQKAFNRRRWDNASRFPNTLG